MAPQSLLVLPEYGTLGCECEWAGVAGKPLSVSRGDMTAALH